MTDPSMSNTALIDRLVDLGEQLDGGLVAASDGLAGAVVAMLDAEPAERPEQRLFTRRGAAGIARGGGGAARRIAGHDSWLSTHDRQMVRSGLGTDRAGGDGPRDLAGRRPVRPRATGERR